MSIGFWGPFYYTYNKEPPKISIGNNLGSYMALGFLCSGSCGSVDQPAALMAMVANPKP